MTRVMALFVYVGDYVEERVEQKLLGLRAALELFATDLHGFTRIPQEDQAGS
jgi:hypothetical protein